MGRFISCSHGSNAQGGDSSLKLRKLIVEFFRGVLRPWITDTVDDRGSRCHQSLSDTALEDLGTMKSPRQASQDFQERC